MDSRTYVERVMELLFYTCGCNFKQAKEILNETLVQVEKKEKEWNTKLKMEKDGKGKG